MTLKVEKLIGGYGQTEILKDISFKVPSATATALIGLNGSGKTTTINHIIGLMRAKSGAISFNGIDLEKDAYKYRKNLAYIPELPLVYDDLTLREHLQVTIAAYHLDRDQAWNKAEKLLSIFRLSDKLDWFPLDFSKGMRQKVMIVCALMTDAPLLVIDEPFIGLDPLAMRDLINLLEERKQAGATILMSTHSVEGIEDLVDDFLLLDRGKIRAQGTVADIFAAFPGTNKLSDIYFKIADEIEHE
ncbi:ABC transporter ATP-binding protein [Oenococcus alcoholitolerans]|uniref:ABC transporter ATP-binding protein n=1 Tax=Oenococcus alcoholitolerans TaxID=931074 RepID=UPI003F71A2D9